MLLKNAAVLNQDFVFEAVDVLVTEGKIAQIAPHISGDGMDLTGRLLLPGLVNVHTHGAAGCDLMETAYEDINRMSVFMAKGGATSFLPTTMTMPGEDIKTAMSNIAKAIRKGVDGACMPGIHMEGPYLSHQYKGAHNPVWLKNFYELDFDMLQEAAEGAIKMVTVAPEIDGAMEFIAQKAHEVTISLGHTGAGYEACMEAFRLGAHHVTHTFNAMPSLHHRQLSLIAAAVDASAYTELICDGLHVASAMLKIAYRIFGDDRIVIVTDSVAATGLDDGPYVFGGGEVIVSGGVARMPDGTISGGTATMWQCVRNMVGLGIALESVIKMASYNPACSIGMEDTKGSIAAGKDADLLIADTEMNLQGVMVGGRLIE